MLLKSFHSPIVRLSLYPHSPGLSQSCPHCYPCFILDALPVCPIICRKHVLAPSSPVPCQIPSQINPRQPPFRYAMHVTSAFAAAQNAFYLISEHLFLFVFKTFFKSHLMLCSLHRKPFSLDAQSTVSSLQFFSALAVGVIHFLQVLLSLLPLLTSLYAQCLINIWWWCGLFFFFFCLFEFRNSLPEVAATLVNYSFAF